MNSKPKQNILKNTGNKLLRSDSLGFTFIRSAVSSQTSGVVDLLTRLAFFQFVHLQPWAATTLGAVAGGIVNCVINYKFTFHATDCPWQAVAVKYVMVWLGSLLLNAGGTELLYRLLCHWHWLEEMGFRPAGYFTAATLTVSILVSWFWNFLLQRYFVFRRVRFDQYALRVAALFNFKKSNKTLDHRIDEL